MQKEILEKNSSANIRVYAVWFSMIPTDARSMWRWGGSTLADGRVVHFWDEQKVVGRWFADHVSPDNSDGGVVWDAYYLYGPEAEWVSTPSPLIAGGATVRGKFGELNQKIVPLLNP